MKGISRVVCAISGGVDSAVAACLLKKRGFDVIGVHMVNWDQVDEGTSNCPQTRDEADARKVCQRLSIPFHVVNFVDQYWRDIFTYLVDNYRRGRTVVSDVRCNKLIKFDRLQHIAFNELQADALATGHFARTSFGDFLDKYADHTHVRLLTAADPLKDQTFFLATLTQAQLRRTMFPVGSLIKTQVRQIARESGLIEVADKQESMGICFIGKKKNFSRFIDEYIEPVVGPVRDIDTGKVIFEHRGIHDYTIGKRIRIIPDNLQSPLGFFVAELDESTQTVWVCEGTHHPALFAREFIVREPEWISESPVNEGGTAIVEFRCQRTHQPFLSKVSRLSNGLLRVKPYNPIRAAAPGQMCVFYKKDECLGGGEIEHVVSSLCN